MNNIMQPDYSMREHSAHARSYEGKQNKTQDKSFFNLMAQASKNMAKTAKINSIPNATSDTNATTVETYTKYLNNKYGNITVQSVGKDEASLKKAASHMNGSSVVIAPNILEDMANSPEKAAYYEKKIDDFFNATPKLNAQFAAKGLTYEPCGVVIHEDGSVTYIGGCSDSPERVAEVNRINAEKAKKKAERQRQYQEQSATMAAQHRVMLKDIIEADTQQKNFANMGSLLHTQTTSAPVIAPTAALPTETNTFFVNL